MMQNEKPADTARPRFYMGAIQNQSESAKQGRPIFEDKEMVEIRIPGDKHLTWVGEVDDALKARWPLQYAAFKRGEQRAVTGTPLEQWPCAELTAARVAEIKAQNILSVEELAGIPDNLLGKIGWHGREIRDQARAYLSASQGNAETNRLAAENAELRQRLEMIEARLSGEPAPKVDKPIEECTPEELKAFIKAKTGSAPRGNPSRESLMAKAAELA